MTKPDTNLDPRKALIAGGGIGGLSAALALAQTGWQVELFERAPAFAEIGAGIQLGPNSMRALEVLGLGTRAEALTVYPDALVMMDAVDGEQVKRIETGAEFAARYGARYGVIHRADLHHALVEACRTHSAVTLVNDAEIQGFVDNGDTVSVTTTQGAAKGDLLVGADGLWSAVRAEIVGDGAPRRSGHVAYRAVLPTIDVPPHLRRNEMVLWAGPKCHLVHYPLRGGDLFNLVAVFHSSRYEEGWDSYGDAEELKTCFAGLHADVHDMLAKIEQWRMWVLCDREPVANWSRGRATLLGDAAHPMLQYLAQGAGMAIEDAVCLARQLAVPDVSVAGALKAYQAERYLRTGRVQLTARLFGEFYHAAGVRRDLRNAYVKTSMSADTLGWLYEQQ